MRRKRTFGVARLPLRVFPSSHRAHEPIHPPSVLARLSRQGVMGSAGGERGSAMAMRGAMTGITSTSLYTIPHVARAGAL
jgi:hypothetical protein